jgi:DNA modification methylase
VAEYINTTRLFIREVLKKLKPNGVAFAIIGETYQGGYKGVCTKYEIAIEDEGGEIIDVNVWEKTNPRRTPHKNHFQPSHERIIVFSRPGAEPIFNEQYQPSKTVEEGYKVLPSSKREDGSKNYHMACDETPVTNVIRTGVFNKSEWEGVDPDFTHDAPAPLEIYDRFLNSYSEPGMTFLDIFCGSGQGLISGMRHGLNVIGYDIDPVSIEFCQKRIEHELEKRNKPEIKLVA